MNTATVKVSIAILKIKQQFLLQLRDNIPNIKYPGYWGLFGGHIEGEENPADAMHRELLEEIGYAPPIISKFGCYESPDVIRHVFYSSLNVDINKLVLLEGWDMGLWTPEDIIRGDRYSEKAQQIRPIGPVHQRILLDFLHSDFSMLKNYD